jgi:putative transposase
MYTNFIARLLRIIVSGIAHHVTQSGNRRQQLLMENEDDALYKEMLAQACRSNDGAIWSYCLIPKHVQLALVPSDQTLMPCF